MDVFIENILRTNKVICDNIDKREVLGDELLYQNVFAQLRHFVEGIARLVCSREKDISNNQKGTIESYDWGNDLGKEIID